MIRTYNHGPSGYTTAKELLNTSYTKGKLFQGADKEGSFDYALPQGWLDDFANWCGVNAPHVTYHLIMSTTVWLYPKNGTHGPMTACREVGNAYVTYLTKGGYGDQDRSAAVHDFIYCAIIQDDWSVVHSHGNYRMQSPCGFLRLLITDEEAEYAKQVILAYNQELAASRV